MYKIRVFLIVFLSYILFGFSEELNESKPTSSIQPYLKKQSLYEGYYDAFGILLNDKK